MRIGRNELLLYAITDRGCIGQRDLYSAIEDACKGGAAIVQLREKHADTNALIETAGQAAAICHRYGVRLIVNDDWKAALAVGADGVHVGITDAPVAEIRKQVPDGFIIGATAKTIEQAQLAEASGADYLGVGAVFPSPTKKDAIRITPEQFRGIAGSVRIPAVAIGGITKENITALHGLGAAGAAVVSAVFGAADIERAAAEMKRLAGGIV
ncbi:MAG: thiamine phosphate synthase [Oscillospiraceae bacterium]|nr:thiamine phosphate synthase [Oscillospiraceae bacterium]